MELKQFKDYISNFPEGKQFTYGISKPFSWRGSYDEVAFSMLEFSMTKEEILKNIELAYTETFIGYTGGEYRYNDWTNVNFEDEDSKYYSDGCYTAEWINKIEDEGLFLSQEERLVKLAFN